MRSFAPLTFAAIMTAAVCALGAQTAPQTGAQTAPQTITVTSPAFRPGQPLPVDYTADGKNVSPPLAWSNLPAGTKEIAVIHEDPSAPTPQPFVHWLIYKIPATAKGLPENIAMDPAVPMPADLTGAVQGTSGFRRQGYRGPAPPKPGKTHEYHFIVYALDAPLEVQAGLNKTQLLEAMKGHIIGQGEVIGTYERKPPQ